MPRPSDNEQRCTIELRLFVKAFVTILFLVTTFTFFKPSTAEAASISSISPATISPGSTEITISGSGFGALDSTGDQVCFNAIRDGFTAAAFCSSFGTSDITLWNDTTIVLKVPADPSALMIGGKIHVNVDYTLIDGPSYHIQPIISAVNVATSWASGTVKLTGKYFKNALGSPNYYYVHAYFNGVEGSVIGAEWSESAITATVPSGATTGLVSMSLVTDDGSASVTATGPTITILTGSTNDHYSALQQYIKQVNIDKAWSLAGTGKAPIVAVIDDGVYINHPDIRKNIWINKKEKIGNNKDDDKNGYIDDIYGWNFISKNGEMTVQGTHGTMVAGIIGAVNNNQEGITGINPSVRIMPLIVCSGQKGCPVAFVTKAILYAVDQGATVINLSLGTKATTGYTIAFDKAIKYANDKGVIVVAAAGNGDIESNSGQDLNIIPQSPVCNDVGKNAVIGVGAVDKETYLTSWSNFGSHCVDAYAPGVDIVTTAVAIYNDLIPGSNYGYGDGTSFSAPIVTGIITLLRQTFPYMPNSEVVKRIRAAANSRGVIDAHALLSEASSYKPALIKKIVPSSVKTSKLIGERTVTVSGEGFSKKTSLWVGNTKAKVKFISSTKLTATFSLSGLSFGKNLITIRGDNKQPSIFRWFELKK